MSLRSRLRDVLRATVRRARAERELDDELRSYLALLTDEKERDGMAPEAARRAALIELGGIDRVKEEVRDERATAVLDLLARDVRHAARSLRRQPVLTVTVLLTLALGIGGATGIFGVIDAALIRPLAGVREPERLVSFLRVQPSGVYDNFSVPDYLDYRRGARTFASIAAHCATWLSTTTANGGGERVRGDLVTGGYFATLGVRPLLGRLLGEGDDGAPGAARVVVLAHDYWRRAFGGDPGIVGRAITLDGTRFTVVGVAPDGFAGTVTGMPTDLWLPLSAQRLAMPRLSAGILDDRGAGWIEVFGRLRDGATIAQARAELSTIAARLARAYPVTDGVRRVELVREVGMYPDDRAEIGGLMRLLSAAVALVLLIACANVAALLLVRLSTRRREMAARLALGAGTSRLVVQSLIEGLVLALPAGALGLAVAALVVHLATVVQPASSVLHALQVKLDGRLFLFALGASVLAGLAVAVLPAMRAARITPASVLVDGGRASAGRRSPLQRALVTGQVALSFVMLAVAAMLVRGLYDMVTAPAGFETHDVAMISVDLVNEGWAPARGAVFFREAVRRLEALPGVRSASVTTSVPPSGMMSRVSLFHPGEEPPPELFHGRALELGLHAGYAAVAPRYFETLGIPLLRGRDFGRGDREGAPGVAIVNEELARELWPGRDAIGQRVSFPAWNGARREPLEVVGVAADGKMQSLTEPAPPMFYVPLSQNYDGRATVVVRSAVPATALADACRVLAGLDPHVPEYGAATMTQHIEENVWRQRMAAAWVIAFGIVALALGAVGVYGVVAQSVTQRTRELSVRMALGASEREVTRLVVREGMVLAVIGLAAGAGAFVGLRRAAARLVEGVAVAGPGTVVTVGAMLALTMLAATWLPARRAARMNPADALRYD